MPIVCAIAVPHPPIILPEIGKGEEAALHKTHAAYQAAAQLVASNRPETVVVISPHADFYQSRFQISPGEGAWGDFANKINYRRNYGQSDGILNGKEA